MELIVEEAAEPGPLRFTSECEMEVHILADQLGGLVLFDWRVRREGGMGETYIWI